MSPRKVGVAAHTELDVAKQLPAGKGWRIVAPGKRSARRAILIKKFQIEGSTIGIFRIFPGTR